MDVMATWKKTDWIIDSSPTPPTLGRFRRSSRKFKWDEFGRHFLNTPDLITFCWSVTTPTDLYVFVCFTRSSNKKKRKNRHLTLSLQCHGREVTDAEQWSQLLRKLATCPPSHVVRSAHRLAPWISSWIFLKGAEKRVGRFRVTGVTQKLVGVRVATLGPQNNEKWRF